MDAANERFGEDSCSVDGSSDYIVHLFTASLLSSSREDVVYTHQSSAATTVSLEFRAMPNVSPYSLQTKLISYQRWSHEPWLAYL